MAYQVYDGTEPDGTTQSIAQVPASVRRNVIGLIDALNMGGIYKDVGMTVQGADPDKPDSVTYTAGQDHLRLSFTWNVDDDPEDIAYENSDDSGNSWEPIGTKHIDWVNGEVSGYTWGIVPAIVMDFAKSPSIGLNATFLRPSEATIVDFEHLMRPCYVDEVRFHGARRVENLFSNSVDASTFTTTAGAVYLGGDTFSLVESGSYVVVQDASRDASRTRFAVSCKLRATNVDSVGKQVDLRLRGNSPNYDVVRTLTVTLTENYKRYGFDEGAFTTNDWSGGVRIEVLRNDIAALIVDIFEPQIENVGGQTNKNPSEYVSNGNGSSTHGSNVDGVKYFNSTNGNTVISGVVTDGGGTTFTDAGLLLEKTMTNLCTSSMLLDTWATDQCTTAIEYNRVDFAPDGRAPVEIYLDNTAASQHRINKYMFDVNCLAGDFFIASAYIKPTGTNDCRILLYHYGLAVTVCRLSIKSDGSLGAVLGDWYEILDVGDGWYKLTVSVAASADSTAAGRLYIGSETIDGDGSSLCQVCSPQVMIGTAKEQIASYIPTPTSNAVVHADESLVYSTPGIHDDIAVIMNAKFMYEPRSSISNNTKMFGTTDSRGFAYSSFSTPAANWGLYPNPPYGGEFGMKVFTGITDIVASPGFNTYACAMHMEDATTRRERLLFNGISKLANSRSAVDQLDHSNENKIALGGSGYTAFDPGVKFKYFAIYNVVLSDEELQQAVDKAQ